MLYNDMKIAWRNLIKNKFHTSINLGGLIIGFTIGISILLVIYGQFKFDKFHVKGDRLFQAYQVFNKPGGEEVANIFGFAQAPAYKAQVSGIAAATRFSDAGNKVEYKGRSLTIPVMLADEDFFSMFSFSILKGNKYNPLKNLTDVVISEDAAKKIFGNEDPIGKSIKTSVGDKLQDLIVSAVVKDVQFSSIKFDVLTRIENRSNYASQTADWGNRSQYVYIELKEGISSRQAELQLKAVDNKYVPEWTSDLIKKGAKPDKYGDVFATRLLPLADAHFSNLVNGHRAINSTQIITLLTIGLLIIFIACFNFVNINLANAFTRSKEIGIRKYLGAAKWKLFVQLWTESFVVCSISFLFSLLLVNIFLHSVNGMDTLRIQLTEVYWQPAFLLLAFALLLFVSLAAGGYPALVMINFNAVKTLKGVTGLKRRSTLRSSLIVVQFAIACIMISCTFIIYRQYQYLQQADLGINKDYIISVPLHDPFNGRELTGKLKMRLSSNPHIISVSGSNINIGRGSDHRTSKSTTGFTYNEREIKANVVSVTYDYLNTLGLKTIDGRDFDKSFGTDTTNGVLVSESLAKQFNDKNLVGKTVGADSTSAGWHIIGIFPDFHLYTMEEALEPMALTLSNQSSIDYCFIKTTSGNLLGNMEAVKKEMAVLEPGQDFNGTFVNENINNWYQEEKSMSILFSIAAVVAIVLSCTGLLAMVLLVIRQRVKEIGVRKVLGASVGSISFLIAKEFLLLILISMLVAIPVSWFVMNKWLADFPYRINIAPWMFMLVSLAAFVLAIATIGVNTVRAALQNPVKNLRTE
ncbi:MAG: FtsX-like permease family protein [Bacteroidota bacterium]